MTPDASLVNFTSKLPVFALEVLLQLAGQHHLSAHVGKLLHLSLIAGTLIALDTTP